MAEYIEREALVDVLAVSHTHHANNSREAALLDRDIRLIWEQPAADVAPVVQCGKCVFWNGGLCGRKMLGLVRPEDFCSFGKRRMDGE